MPIVNKPAAPRSAPQSAGQSAVAPRGNGLSLGSSSSGKIDPKMLPPPGGVTPGEPMDYKTHALIGRRAADGHLLLLESWPYCPTQDEIKAVCAAAKFPYVQFAIVNVNGFWDTVEPEKKPLWTSRP